MFLNSIYKNFLEAIDTKGIDAVDIGDGWFIERSNYFYLKEFSLQKIRSVDQQQLVQWLAGSKYSYDSRLHCFLTQTLVFLHCKSTVRFVLTYRRRDKFIFRLYYSGLNKNKAIIDDKYIYKSYSLVNGAFCHDGFSFSSDATKYYSNHNNFFQEIYLKNMHMITSSKNNHYHNEFEVLVNQKGRK